MTGDRIASVAFVAMAMTLVLAGLVVRRLPMRRTAALAVVWAGIFALTGDRIASVAFVAMAMTLVLAGLVVRRLPMRRTAALAVVWAGIFALAFAIARLIR